jgi:endonuclease/exonuclease/phosphatase family metal-dependent hydrolase
MRLLVRTWNLFHGRTVPETGRTHVEGAVRLVTADGPDVVCLQEVPVWAARHLAEWSGMRAFAAVAMPALGGPLARRVTELDARRLRSALTGQANAVLVREQLRVPARETLPLNPRTVRRREAARLGLPLATRLGWSRNRRVAQLLRVDDGEATLVVVNLHLTTSADSRLADAELLRAATYAEGFARPAEAIVVAGDLNLTASSSTMLRELGSWGFSAPAAGIDHLLVRGLRVVRGPEAWSEARRRVDGELLSDHAPVEAEMMSS